MRHDLDNRPGSPAAVPMVQKFKAGVLWLAFACWPAFSAAHEFSIEECVEGGDFIKNAALARDRGVSEDHFISKIRDDIEIIQAFPPHLRWFVQDEDDATFLIGAASAVFQEPKPARMHQAEFFASCVAKAKSDGRFSSGL